MSPSRLTSWSYSPALGRLLLFVLFSGGACSQDHLESSAFYQFSRNLPLAEVRQEVDVIDFGTPEAHRHLVKGWSFDERFQGPNSTTFVWSLGEESQVEFFLAEIRDLEISFSCFPLQSKELGIQKVTVSANGTEIGTVELTSGMGTYSLLLPESRLIPGINRLSFEYAYAIPPAQFMPNSTDYRVLAVGWDQIKLSDRPPPVQPQADFAAAELFIPFGTQIDYFIRLPEQATFFLAGVHSGSQDAGGRLKVFKGSGENQTELLEITQDTNEPLLLPIEIVEDEITQFSFRSTAHRASRHEGIRLFSPEIRSSRLAPVGKRPNVIIYLIDTLRADHLHGYGYEKDISPNIDALAREAVLFTNAIAQSSWTRSSVGSLFTGLDPRVHGANDTEDALPPRAVTLAEILRGVGYHTAAFVANPVVNYSFGFTQGFVDFVTPSPKGAAPYALSDNLNDHVFSWLDGRQSEGPILLYVQTMDPHGPYSPEPEFRRAFAPAIPSELGSAESITALHRKETQVTPELRRDIVSLYDAEVAFNDASFGVLVEELKRRDLYENSLVLLLSDHGEEFFEHGMWEHRKTLYQEVLRIPLILKFPGSDWAGRKIDQYVDHSDLLPTILDYLNIAPPRYLTGSSVLASITDSEAVARPTGKNVFPYFVGFGRELAAVLDGDWKLIRTQNESSEKTTLELFDLAEDPQEQHNLLSSQPDVAKKLLSRLTEYEAEELPPNLDSRKVEIPEELMDKLRALGYLQ